MKNINNKGFTLIELITVIALLSIMMVISIPKINSSIKESRADQLEEVRQDIVKAVDVYFNSSCGKDNYNKLIEVDEVKVYLNVISDCGIIEEKIYNPVAGNYFNIDNEFVIVRIDEVGLIDYELSF